MRKRELKRTAAKGRHGEYGTEIKITNLKI